MMSTREERKMKDALARIERLEQEQKDRSGGSQQSIRASSSADKNQSTTNGRKRKRSSLTGSENGSQPPTRPTSRSKDQIGDRNIRSQGSHGFSSDDDRHASPKLQDMEWLPFKVIAVKRYIKEYVRANRALEKRKRANFALNEQKASLPISETLSPELQQETGDSPDVNRAQLEKDLFPNENENFMDTTADIYRPEIEQGVDERNQRPERPEIKSDIQIETTNDPFSTSSQITLTNLPIPANEGAPALRSEISGDQSHRDGVANDMAVVSHHNDINVEAPLSEDAHDMQQTGNGTSRLESSVSPRSHPATSQSSTAFHSNLTESNLENTTSTSTLRHQSPLTAGASPSETTPTQVTSLSNIIPVNTSSGIISPILSPTPAPPPRPVKKLSFADYRKKQQPTKERSMDSDKKETRE
ncbi:uncharacterized protein V1510DRAFT_294775 [Dipodascopsis tothii]|uniref:uncharacterized protein n=1 Tax=Dipodascopsis tothii TaxID=44089 RepID=UPI0034CD14B6